MIVKVYPRRTTKQTFWILTLKTKALTGLKFDSELFLRLGFESFVLGLKMSNM